MADMYSNCPKCGGEIEYEDYEFDYSIWQPQKCVDCDFEWQAVYQFTHNETRDSIPLDSKGNEINFYNNQEFYYERYLD